MFSQSVSRAIVIFYRSLSPLLSFWSSVSPAIVIFSLLFLSDDDKDHDDLTKDCRLFKSVCRAIAVVLFSLSPPSSLLLVVCHPSYRLLPSPALLFLFDDDDDDDHTKHSPAFEVLLNSSGLNIRTCTPRTDSPLVRGVCVHPDSKLRVLARHALCALVEAARGVPHLWHTARNEATRPMISVLCTCQYVNRCQGNQDT